MTKTPLAVALLAALAALAGLVSACAPDDAAPRIRVDAPTEDEGAPHEGEGEASEGEGEPGEGEGEPAEGEGEEPGEGEGEPAEGEGEEPSEGEGEPAEGEGEGEGEDEAAPSPTCDGNAHTGEYCGGDKVSHANEDTLYHCNGPGPATVVRACAHGCFVAPPGQDDFCSSPPPTCDANANVGDYCGGDKVSHADPDVLYFCDGPGPATVAETCDDSCVVAPAGQDDYCATGIDGDCPHLGQLRFGLAPAQSDHMRCAGVTASGISQTIGNASASAGTHAQDGTIGGFAYCAATDLRTSGLTNAQVHALVNRLTDQGFAAFFRNPGHDGWPSNEARHIHAIYVGVPMKSSLRSQVQDWLAGRNGLVSHSAYTFFTPTSAQRSAIQSLFNAHN